MEPEQLREELKTTTLWELLDMVSDEYHRNPMRQWRDHMVLQELDRRIASARRTRDERHIDNFQLSI